MLTALGRIPTDRRGEAEKLSVSLSVSPATRRGDVPGVLLPMQTAACHARCFLQCALPSGGRIWHFVTENLFCETILNAFSVERRNQQLKINTRWPSWKL